jgi:hypothetical protein
MSQEIRRIFQIDGNYFAQRMLGALNMGEKINNLETRQEQQQLTIALNSSLISLYEVFKPFVDQIIFTTDNYSWRKDIIPFKPYWINDDRPISYKENRKAKKEESPINYDNFYSIYRDFIESLKSKMIVFDIHGLEGDDLLMLISNKLKDNPLIELITFCTDGDLMQIVKDNSMLFRNIKSGNAPFGEFVISFKKYQDIFTQTKEQQLLGSSIDFSFYKRLFGINLNFKTTVSREYNAGIALATPFKVALSKSICGDRKDNLFSVLGWKSTTGTKDFKITETHLKKAFETQNLKYTEGSCRKILSDPDLLTNILIELKKICKQPNAVLKSIQDHLKHNLKLNVLTPSNIPEKYLIEFENIWNAFEKDILESKFDDTILKKTNLNQKDSAVNLMEQSVPKDLLSSMGVYPEIKYPIINTIIPTA